MAKKKPLWPDDLRRQPQPQQVFDVITIPQGTSPLSAPIAQFSRTRVRAENSFAAQMDIVVVRTGRTVVAVVPQGELSEPERLARQRSEERVDLVNIGAPRVLPSHEA